MVRIELTSEEADVLRETLESDLSDLRMELADTDNIEFRAILKKKEAPLKQLLDRL